MGKINTPDIRIQTTVGESIESKLLELQKDLEIDDGTKWSMARVVRYVIYSHFDLGTDNLTCRRLPN